MKEKSKKNKKGLIIGIIVIVIIVVAGIGGFTFYHIQQLATLTAEINKATSTEVFNENGEINKDSKIDMEIKTNGKYSIVEKTLKDYLNETFTLCQDVENIYDEEIIENVLTIENIKTDGPDFTETKARIAQMEQKSNDYLSKLTDLCSEEKLLAAIDDKDVNDYYKELYRKLAIDEETSRELKQTLEEIESTKQSISGGFAYITKLLNFLSENKSSWKVEDDQIAFYSQQKLDEYNKLIEEAPTD